MVCQALGTGVTSQNVAGHPTLSGVEGFSRLWTLSAKTGIVPSKPGRVTPPIPR